MEMGQETERYYHENHEVSLMKGKVSLSINWRGELEVRAGTKQTKQKIFEGNDEVLEDSLRTIKQGS